MCVTAFTRMGAKENGGPGSLPARREVLSLGQLQTGSPSFVAVPPTEIEHVFAVELWLEVAAQPVVVTVPIVTVTPVEAL